MRVGVDATCWANDRGYGRFTRELVSAMAVAAPNHEFACFLDARAADRFTLAAPNTRAVVVEQGASPTLAAGAKGNRSVADMLRLTRAVGRAHLDVFFSPTVYSYFPLPLRLPAVVTIHDAIAEQFPKLTLPSPRARLFWQLKVKLALAQASVLVTVSDFAAAEIAKVHGIRRSRLRVALEAPSSTYRPSESDGEIAMAAARAGLPADAAWITYVGGFNPHKNVDVLLRARREASRRLTAPLHVVLVGTVDGDVFHSNVAALRDLVRANGDESFVHWTGFLPDEEIRHLHSGARALVLPSENEGFGLPAVEAAACGTPVIATTRSPLPQLLAGAGLFVDPRDEAALADALVTIASDPSLRQRMGDAGRAAAAGLSWDRGARVAIRAIEDAVA
jgi:glycosyltransferase involved in cell wall biosynthesis